MRSLVKAIFIVATAGAASYSQEISCKTGQRPPRDQRVIEQQILKVNREYSEMIKRGNASEIRCVLAEDYTLTDENGRLFTKTDDLATYKDREFVITTTDTTLQKVRIVGEVVIVHTTVNFKGTRNTGPFDLTEQCTTVWAWRDGRWQIISDHISIVKK